MRKAYSRPDASHPFCEPAAGGAHTSDRTGGMLIRTTAEACYRSDVFDSAVMCKCRGKQGLQKLQKAWVSKITNYVDVHRCKL